MFEIVCEIFVPVSKINICSNVEKHKHLKEPIVGSKPWTSHKTKTPRLEEWSYPWIWWIQWDRNLEQNMTNDHSYYIILHLMAFCYKWQSSSHRAGWLRVSLAQTTLTSSTGAKKSQNGLQTVSKWCHFFGKSLIQVTFYKWLEGLLWQINHIHLLEADLPAIMFDLTTLPPWLFLVGLCQIRLK